MPIIKRTAVYPLRTVKVMWGGKTYYDRDKRGKSWIILDLAIDENRRKPEYLEPNNT